MKSQKARHRAHGAVRDVKAYLRSIGAVNIQLRNGRRHNVMTFTLDGQDMEFAVPRKAIDVDYVPILVRHIRTYGRKK